MEGRPSSSLPRRVLIPPSSLPSPSLSLSLLLFLFLLFLLLFLLLLLLILVLMLILILFLILLLSFIISSSSSFFSSSSPSFFFSPFIGLVECFKVLLRLGASLDVASNTGEVVMAVATGEVKRLLTSRFLLYPHWYLKKVLQFFPASSASSCPLSSPISPCPFPLFFHLFLFIF